MFDDDLAAFIAPAVGRGTPLQWSPQQEMALAIGQSFVAGVRRARRQPNNPKTCKIFGFAGTGKSTLVSHLVGDMDGVIYCAPTGKAAKVLRMKGCPDAMTLHRALYKVQQKTTSRLVELHHDLDRATKEDPKSPEVAMLQQLVQEEEDACKGISFSINPMAPAFNARMLVIEEASMVGSRIGRDVCSIGIPLLIIGDPGQLPPVKDTAYFMEDPDIVLTEIHRQAADSGILRLATEVRQSGRYTIGDYGPDCRVVLHGTRGGDNARNTQLVMAADQMIVGKHTSRRLANFTLRKAKGRVGTYPLEGDKLICTSNNNDLDLMNGSQWVCRVPGRERLQVLANMELESLDEPDETSLTVDAHACIFRGDDVPATKRRDAEHFDFGEAITGHKSQGSQWDKVYALDESSSFGKEWLYTVVTRAAKDLTLVAI